MESKYKVGDKVTIKKLSREDSSSYRFGINGDMAELAGKSFRILKITTAISPASIIPDDGYKYKLDEPGDWSWASSMFEDQNAFIREKKCPELGFSL